MNQKVPISLRFSEELENRLETCSKKLKIRKHTLAQLAIEAAVEAIEQNDYKIVVPIRFEVSDVASRFSKPNQIAGTATETEPPKGSLTAAHGPSELERKGKITIQIPRESAEDDPRPEARSKKKRNPSKLGGEKVEN